MMPLSSPGNTLRGFEKAPQYSEQTVRRDRGSVIKADEEVLATAAYTSHPEHHSVAIICFQGSDFQSTWNSLARTKGHDR